MTIGLALANGNANGINFVQNKINKAAKSARKSQKMSAIVLKLWTVNYFGDEIEGIY